VPYTQSSNNDYTIIAKKILFVLQYGLQRAGGKNCKKMRNIVLIILLILVASGGLVWWQNLPKKNDQSPTQSQAQTVTEKPIRPLAVIEAVNEVRKDSGQPELTTDSRLFKSAMAKANDMCDREYFSHESPTGLNPWYWLQQSEFLFSTAGENLARNVTELPELIASWAASPTHHQNMVDPRFSVTGVALRTCRIEGQETMVVVQHFASPSDQK
jgi:hypothetical protein